MRSVKSLIAAGAASLLSTAALAADMPSIMPAPEYYAPPAQDFGGWYLRGDVGMTNSNATLHVDSYDTLPAGSSLQQLGHGFTGGTSWGLGVGYEFNSWFRADVTGEYRSKVNFSGTDFASIPGFGPISDVYTGGYKSWVALVNAYVDLGTWWCLTPFIGAGVGAAHIQTTGFQDSGALFTTVGIPPATQAVVTGASYFANGASTNNFAWAAHAGVAYKVTNNFTVELAYRYLDMGDGLTGDLRTFDGTNNINNPMTFKNITSHDLKLGVRWNLESPPVYQPPLVRKG